MSERFPVWLAGDGVLCLATDGTMWTLDTMNAWQQLPALPQPAAVSQPIVDDGAVVMNPIGGDE